MTVELGSAFSHKPLVETGFSFKPQNTDFTPNHSRETVIDTGVKIAGAVIFAIGLYKVLSAENLTDLVIGGVLVYAGYKIFTHNAGSVV